MDDIIFHFGVIIVGIAIVVITLIIFDEIEGVFKFTCESISSKKNIDIDDKINQVPKKTHKIKRADELPQLPTVINCIKYEHDYCTKCEHYDGYDVCLCKYHWGSVIQNTVEYCSLQNNYIPKRLK